MRALAWFIGAALYGCSGPRAPLPDATIDVRPDAHVPSCVRLPGTCQLGWVPWQCDGSLEPTCSPHGSVCHTDGAGWFCCMPCL